MRKRIDLTGKSYGRLVVISPAEDYVSPRGAHRPMWRCRCECGGEKVVQGGHLKSGDISSCGCFRGDDLTGLKFERLTVVSRAEDQVAPSGAHRPMWRCRCECGALKSVLAVSLKSGATRSCGCLRKELTATRFRKTEGESVTNQIINSYKQHARQRGLAFELSREEFRGLISMDCAYCGAPPGNKQKGLMGTPEQREANSIIYQGIDRKDNDLGYSTANCTPSCFSCNTKKKAMKFDTWIARISTRRSAV